MCILKILLNLHALKFIFLFIELVTFEEKCNNQKLVSLLSTLICKC